MLLRSRGDAVDAGDDQVSGKKISRREASPGIEPVVWRRSTAFHVVDALREVSDSTGSDVGWGCFLGANATVVLL